MNIRSQHAPYPADEWIRTISSVEAWTVLRSIVIIPLQCSRGADKGEIRLPLQCSNHNQDAWRFLFFASEVSISDRACPNSSLSRPCSDSLPTRVGRSVVSLIFKQKALRFVCPYHLENTKYSKETFFFKLTLKRHVRQNIWEQTFWYFVFALILSYALLT